MDRDEYSQRLEDLRPIIDEAVAFVDGYSERYQEEIFRAVLAIGLGRLRAPVAVQADQDATPPFPSPAAADGDGPLARLSGAVGIPTGDLRRVVDLDPESKRIRILGRVHGDSTSERQNKCSAVYAYIKEKAFGDLDVEIEELRQLCDDHNCYDVDNFTSNFRKSSMLNEVKGSKPRKYIPTKSGLAEAESVLREMAET